MDWPNFGVDNESDHMADEDTGPRHEADHGQDIETQMRLLHYDFSVFNARQDNAAQRQQDMLDRLAEENCGLLRPEASRDLSTTRVHKVALIYYAYNTYSFALNK